MLLVGIFFKFTYEWCDDWLSCCNYGWSNVCSSVSMAQTIFWIYSSVHVDCSIHTSSIINCVFNYISTQYRTSEKNWGYLFIFLKIFNIKLLFEIDFKNFFFKNFVPYGLANNILGLWHWWSYSLASFSCSWITWGWFYLWFLHTKIE